MSTGRVLGSVTASLAVAGCAIVVVGMSRADSRPSARAGQRPVAATPTARPAFLPATRPAGSAAALVPATVTPSHRSSASVARATASATPTHTAPVVTVPPPTVATTPPRTSAAPTATYTPAPRTTTAAPRVKPTARRTSPPPTPRTTHATTTTVSAKRGAALPLHFATGSARKVITVVAHSYGSTTATLQAWSKAGGGGWLKHGSPVTAHVGSDGLSSHASESRSATPIGSFTLTRAFGHDSNPGTSLPYLHTTPAAWWISQPGKLYNTLQVCSSHCAFNQGSPNEHLYYETPYYDYAVVIDYNTRNAPGGVHQGKGSAFFLHVTDGNPTAGCVSIPMSKLTSIMRWLTPQSHARILIGVRG